MIARLLALVLVSAFSLAPFAKAEDKSEELIKKFAACNEEEAAKHLGLVIVVVVGAAFSKDIQQQLAPYEAQMDRAETCADYSAAYRLLTEIFRNVTGQPADELFATEDGRKGLEEIIDQLRKLKK